jgi:hypothetical protein
MVLNNAITESIKVATLDIFDVVSHFGISDDTSPEAPSSDVLTDESFRKALDSVDQDDDVFTYNFEGVLSLSEANGENISKVGFFTASSGDNLKLSKVLPVTVAKSATKEINIGYQLSIEVVDNT